MHSLFLLALAATALAVPISEREDDSSFTFYPLLTPLSGPCDLEVGQDGALWGQDILVEKLFRVDPDTAVVTEYDIPFTTPFSNVTIPGIDQLLQDRTALACAIRKGQDGHIYFANGLRNQLGRINITTKAIQIFEPPVDPLGNLFPFNDLYSAADGMWFTQTTGNVFQKFDFDTETFTTVTVPTPLALPLGCFVDSWGIVYIAELVGNKILTYDPSTEELNEYPLPEPLQFPAVIRAEWDGYVYFSLFVGNGIGRISQTTHEIELYHTDQLLQLGSEDTIDSQGGVWLSSFTTNVMSRLDTSTLEFSYVTFPDTFASDGLNGVLGDIPPYVDIAVNYGPGDAIWFTSLLFNEIGRYALS